MAQRPRMRPTFEIPLKGDGSDVLGHIKDHLDEGGCVFTGQVLNDHAFVRRPAGDRSLLSPHLNIEVADGNGGRILRGRFSPRPNVWTGFMALYGILVMVAVTGLVYGWAQTTVDEYPWGFWLIPAALALIAFVYGAAVIGQGLTADEMYELRACVDRAVTDCEAESGHGKSTGQDPS